MASRKSNSWEEIFANGSIHRRFLEMEATMKVLVKSAWGPDDPTKAAFPILHSHALAEAGHEVQIFFTGGCLPDA
jgi:hypothetical protein